MSSEKTEKVQIRPIEETDFQRIAVLSQELGYRVSPLLVKKQINAILSQSDQYAFAAMVNDHIVGYIQGFIAIRLTSEPFAEIGGLIVSEAYRNYGIGKQLVEHFEQETKGVASVRVRCNVKRVSAHRFYSSLNYEEKKEQKVFEKRPV